MPRIIDLISRQDARHRVLIALAAAAAVFFSLRGMARLSTAVIATWDAFAFFMLALAWLTILTTPQNKLRGRAQQQDVGRTAIFVFVVVVACAAVFLLLRKLGQLLFAVAAVVGQLQKRLPHPGVGRVVAFLSTLHEL